MKEGPMTLGGGVVEKFIELTIKKEGNFTQRWWFTGCFCQQLAAKAKIKIDFNKSYSTFKQCCYEYEPFSKGFEPDFFICSYQPNIYLKPSALFH